MGLDFDAPFGDDIKIGGISDFGLLGNTGEDFGFLIERDELIQRLIRRLLTAPGEWIPFPDYGAGLRSKVNAPITAQVVRSIRSVVVTQMLKEPDVAPTPPPEVTVSSIPSGLFLQIRVFTQPLGLVTFNLNVGTS